MKKIVLVILFLVLSCSVIYAYKDDAIIVLGCGMLEKKTTSRVLKAIDDCTPDTKYIIFSGNGIYNISEAEFMINIYEKYNKNCLALPIKEEQSYTTISNAYYSLAFVRAKNITNVTVVTSKNHFYAPIIFKVMQRIENIPIDMQFSFSEYTTND